MGVKLKVLYLKLFEFCWICYHFTFHFLNQLLVLMKIHVHGTDFEVDDLKKYVKFTLDNLKKKLVIFAAY